MNYQENHGGGSAPQTTGVPESKIVPPQAPGTAFPDSSLKDALFAVLTLVCAYCFVRLVQPFSPGFGTTVFSVLYFTLTLCYLRASSVVPPAESWWWLALSLLSSAAFSLFDSSLKPLLLLYLMVCAVYWFACCTASRLESSPGPFFITDLLNQFFRVPFANFGCGFRVIGRTAAKNGKSRNLFAALCGAAAALPLLALAVSLLIQADATFERTAEELISHLGERVTSFLLRLIPSAFVACYLFGLFFGDIKHHRIDRLTAEKVREKREKRKALPSAAMIAALSLFCLLYFLFFAAQIVTLVSAFRNAGPVGLSYAEYARKGFFELCGVSGLNLLILGVCWMFTDQKSGQKVFRIFTSVLCIQTMLLIGTALSKMFLYIGRFGMTRLRVYTSWFMLFLLVVFALLLAAQFKKIRLTRLLIVLGSIFFLLLFYADTDSLIVRYNVDRYRAGTLSTLDVESFYEIPSAAVPPLLELYGEEKDPAVKGRIKTFLENCEGSDASFEANNLQRIRKNDLLKNLKISGDR